jgi:hypothetical protein
MHEEKMKALERSERDAAFKAAAKRRKDRGEANAKDARVVVQNAPKVKH